MHKDSWMFFFQVEKLILCLVILLRPRFIYLYLSLSLYIYLPIFFSLEFDHGRFLAGLWFWTHESTHWLPPSCREEIGMYGQVNLILDCTSRKQDDYTETSSSPSLLVLEIKRVSEFYCSAGSLSFLIFIFFFIIGSIIVVCRIFLFSSLASH